MTKAAELAKMGEVLDNSQIGGRRNLIINGAMQVAQRGDTTSVQSGYGGCDRLQFASSGAMVVTLKQSTDVPSNQGFISSQQVDVTTADSSLSSNEYAMIRQKIEAQDLQHLKYGTSEAEKITLQFFVKSSKTGTHIIELYHYDANYQNAQAYTISSADTWQKVTVTFDGYQTTNFNNDNGTGLGVQWWLASSSTYAGGTLASNTWHNTAANRAVGQVNVMDSTDNNFYLTGVQLEVGSQATPFEHRSFGEELALCQRYYTVIADGAVLSSTSFGIGTMYTSSTVYGVVEFPTEMRANPSVETTDIADSMVFYRNSAGDLLNEVAFGIATPNRVEFFNQSDVSGTAGQAGFFRLNSSSAKLAAKSEL